MKKILGLVRVSATCLAWVVGSNLAYGQSGVGQSVDAGDVRSTGNSVLTVIEDMTQPHEVLPRLPIPGWGSLQGPQVLRGDRPPTHAAAGQTSSATWNVVLPWGVVFEAEPGNQATNTRVELRNIRIYMLRRSTQQWVLLKASTLVQGEEYKNDFSVARKPDVRKEPGGTVSVRTGNGWNYHFWTANGRSMIDPADIGGFFSTFEARLIVHDPKLPDDRHRAKYLAYAGADYWPNLSGTAMGNIDSAIGLGRFKWVKPEWRWYNMTTVRPQEVRLNPPPVFD